MINLRLNSTYGTMAQHTARTRPVLWGDLKKIKRYYQKYRVTTKFKKRLKETKLKAKGMWRTGR